MESEKNAIPQVEGDYSHSLTIQSELLLESLQVQINGMRDRLYNQEEKFNTVKTFFHKYKKVTEDGKVIFEFPEEEFNDFEQKNCSIQ